MRWPYEFVKLTPEEVHARRLTLDTYGRYGEALVLLPALLALLTRLGLAVAARIRVGLGRQMDSSAVYEAVPAAPNSPALKSRRRSARGAWASWVQRAHWWLTEDVVIFRSTCGQRDQWLVGAAWTALLLVLCVLQTGRDYMHVTKRFGTVGASQFPVQYILGLKWANPFVPIFGRSHEQLNRWHRVLGVIVYGLLCIHVALYINFFVRDSSAVPELLHRLFGRPIVVAGLVGFVAMTALSFTALIAPLRRWSYRIFFVTHVLVAFAVPPLIIFHTRHAGPYMAASLLLLLADMTMRKIHTVSAVEATVEYAANDPNGRTATTHAPLMRITAPLPAAKLALFRAYPASHVYVSLPAAGRPSRNPLAASSILFEFLFNPFTVAAVREDTGELTLVMRCQKGPIMAVLAQAAASKAAEDKEGGDADDDDQHGRGPDPIASTPPPFSLSGQVYLNIEGPYGASAHFPDLHSLRNFDRVLLVAGGVGATFALPFYRALVPDDKTADKDTENENDAENDQGTNPGPKVDFVWVVRSAAEASWADDIAGPAAATSSILEDGNNVRVFVTGTAGTASTRPENGIEMSSPSLSANGALSVSHGRPVLRHIVDDVFKQGAEQRVAVLVCGPETMARDVRAAVRPWVYKGRTVWWHNEAFAW